MNGLPPRRWYLSGSPSSVSLARYGDGLFISATLSWSLRSWRVGRSFHTGAHVWQLGPLYAVYMPVWEPRV